MDLLLVNAGVVDPLNPVPGADAVAVRGGTIAAVGRSAELLGLRAAATTVVDLQGGALLPGFTDAHIHPISGQEAARGIDLGFVRDLTGLREVLADARHEDGWVLGWNMRPDVFPQGALIADLIEDVLGGAPAYLELFDGHAALAGREALRRASLDHPGVVRDAAGRPTGHLLEDAIELVQRVIPAEPREAFLARLEASLAAMAASGLTGGHVMDCRPQDLAAVEALEKRGSLPLRLRFAPVCHPGSDAAALAEIVAMLARRGERWTVEAVKFFIDGTIDGGTAWLERPDRDGASTHPYWPDLPGYADAVRFFADRGTQTATHAIGDAGIGHCLDVLGSVPRGVAPHRIEHIETLPDALVGRFAELGVVASMQPTHCTDYTRADHADNWSARLGDERADHGWRCRDIADTGAILALGSDWPVADFRPLHVMAAAQLRRAATDPAAAANHPEQGLTARQVLAGYTTQAAAAAGEADVAGRIAPGYRADFTALSADPLTVPAAHLTDVGVLHTIVAGAVI